MPCLVSFVLSVLLSCAPASNVPDKAWLDVKGREVGVHKLPSGLMYKVLESGTADGASPLANTPCDVTYAGQLTNGMQFDAGESTFAPNQVIAGWTEAMQLMKVGDKWELYVPSELAYGEEGRGDTIPGDAALVFQMKIERMRKPLKTIMARAPWAL